MEWKSAQLFWNQWSSLIPRYKLTYPSEVRGRFCCSFNWEQDKRALVSHSWCLAMWNIYIFCCFKSKSWTCSSKTELPVPFNSGLKPGTGLVKDDPLARMMKMTKSFEERKKERIYLFGDFWNPHKNLFSLTQLTFTSSSSDSRTTNYFPRNQGITGESWALKDWCKCFTQSSKEGNDLWEVPKGAVGN